MSYTYTNFRKLTGVVLTTLATCATFGTIAPNADACGCVSPPVPTVANETYGVNQQSEQIIFETEPGYVTAHVLIRYAGDPSQFAWLVPVPAAPELSLSESLLFGLLDNASAPITGVGTEDLCPSPEYYCNYHSPCDSGSSSYSAVASGGPTGGGGGAGNFDPNNPDGIDIKSKQQIGSYDTVVFAAGDAMAAVNWLQSEGFIVNDTMTPYMQPYLDMNMLFVAAKLIPGAGAEEIKPLKMRYAADNPMIPLQLTAVAAEPNLTVTSYIFGEQPFVPDGHPLVTLDATDLSIDAAGRTNYPMLLAKAIDDAGHDGFIMEYAGTVPLTAFEQEQCCGARDQCLLGGNSTCECPNTVWDEGDCAETEGLLESVAALKELRTKHGHMTRLTTRLSPEEMTFDPGFAPIGNVALNGRLSLSNTNLSLQGCEDDIIDTAIFEEINLKQQCSTVYCGAGECVATPAGAGCLCQPGFVARTFSDLDGLPSVTCVPNVSTVDFSDGGTLILPDACVGVLCGEGSCLDVGGFPTCVCGPGTAAVASITSNVPVCSPVVLSTGTRGATNYNAALDLIAVCAPAPPTCGSEGWLVAHTEKVRQGVICASSVPDYSATVEPPAPICPLDDGPIVGGGSAGCGCTIANGDDDNAAFALLLFAAAVGALARRQRRGRVARRRTP